ncbi:MAG: hypothetical protein ACRD1K_15645, partial [Acidimicrobiales bacterium]
MRIRLARALSVVGCLTVLFAASTPAGADPDPGAGAADGDRAGETAPITGREAAAAGAFVVDDAVADAAARLAYQAVDPSVTIRG